MDVQWNECDDNVHNLSEMEMGIYEVKPFNYDTQEFPALNYTDVQKNILKRTFPGTGEVEGMDKLIPVHAGKVQEGEGAEAADLQPEAKPVYPQYVSTSLKILDEYVKANLNPPEKQISIKLGPQSSQRKAKNKGKFWKGGEVGVGHVGQRDRQTMDIKRQTNKQIDKRRGDRKKLFWKGFSSFTDSPNLNELSKCQEEICKWMNEEEEEQGDEEEIRKLEEEKEKEEEVLMEIARRGAPRPKRERREKGKGRNENNDWSKEGEIQREAYRLVENAKKPGEARLVEGNISRQIWGIGQITLDGEQDLGNGEIILVDPGNLSQSLMGINTLRRMEKALGRKIRLDKYERRVKGAGGGEIELLGRTRERLKLKMVGFSNYIYFRPIISSQNLPHLNLALSTMKNHQLSLHMRRENTLLEDLNNHERIELYSRNDLMRKVRQVYSIEVISYVGRLKSVPHDKVHAADLVDLNILETRLKGEVERGKVLVEHQNDFELVNNLREAWSFKGGKEAKLRQSYPGNLTSDIRKAKAMVSLAGPQYLRPQAHVLIPANTAQYVPCKGKVKFNDCYLVQPVTETSVVNSQLLVPPTLGSMRNPQSIIYVPVVNLTNQDIHLEKSQVIGNLEAVSPEDLEITNHTWQEGTQDPVQGGGGEQLGPHKGGPEGETYVKLHPPEEKRRSPQEYQESGFTLLKENGEVEKHLNGPSGFTCSQDHLEAERRSQRKKDFWRPNGPRVTQSELNKAEEKMWKQWRERGEEDEMDPELGKKTNSRKTHSDYKGMLKDAEKLVKQGDKGLFAHGEIYPDKMDIDKERIREEEEKELEAEKRKKYLKDLPEHELKEFLEREFKLDQNQYLSTLPTLKGIVNQILFQNFEAFTPKHDDPQFKYDPGFCKQIVYHPELKPQFKDKIFTAPIKRLSPSDDLEFGRILRAWVRAGILRKQSIDDPQNRSEHNHRVVLVRKKPEEGGPVGTVPKPKRVTLDLRDLNRCSYTHKFHLAGVSDHLSNLEKGKCFATWDLDNYFSSIPCSEYGSRLLSFSTYSHGSFSFLRLAQGWSSSPGAAGALGSRLTSVLDPGTLSLFVDDGLQFGQQRWVNLHKILSLSRYGDVKAVMKENQANPTDKGVNGEKYFFKTEKGDILEGDLTDFEEWSHTQGGEASKPSGADIPSGAGLTSSKLGDDKLRMEVHSNQKYSKRTIPLSDQDKETGIKVYIHENLDLAIKISDFLQAVIKFNLKLSPHKARIFVEHTDYLGYRLSKDGIKMQQGYLDTILGFKIPSSQHILKSYLGLVQYFAGITPHLARYTGTLYDALKREKKGWSLTLKEIDFFHKSKVCFLRSKGVGYIELDALQDRPLRLFTDWSTLSTAGILCQIQRNDQGTWQDVLVGVTGSKNTKVVSQGGSCLGEYYSLVKSLAKFRPYLLLSVFDVFSDFLSLKYLHSFSHLKGVHFRLYQQLSDYVFRLYTISSGQNYASDLVSRLDNVQMSPEEKELIGIRENGTMVIDQDEDLFKKHWLSNAGYDTAVDRWCENQSEKMGGEEKSNISEQSHNVRQCEGDGDTLSGDSSCDGGVRLESVKRLTQSECSETGRRSTCDKGLDQPGKSVIRPATVTSSEPSAVVNTHRSEQGNLSGCPPSHAIDYHQVVGRAGLAGGNQEFRGGFMPQRGDKYPSYLKPGMREGDFTKGENIKSEKKFRETKSEKKYFRKGYFSAKHYEINESVMSLSQSNGSEKQQIRPTLALKGEDQGQTSGQTSFSPTHFNAGWSHYRGLYNQGTFTQNESHLLQPTMCQPSMHNVSTDVRLNQIKFSPTKLSYCCENKASFGHCNHLQLKFPGILGNDDIFAVSCIPTGNRAVVQQKFHTQNIYKPIDREELIQHQRDDRLLTKLRYFIQTGWPNEREMKQIFPTRGLMEYFYRRDLVEQSPDGLLYMKRDHYERCLEERVCIPNNLIYHCFEISHYGLENFHASVAVTYEALNFRYFIPELTKYLRYFISRCADCVQARLNKPNRLRRLKMSFPQFVGKLGAFNENIYSDISGQLVLSSYGGFKYFLVIIDKYSGFIATCPLRSLDTEELVCAFLQNWISKYGPPALAISDVGSQYTSARFQKVFKQLNILQKFSNTSIPRSEFAELAVKRLKIKLKSALCGLRHHSDWPYALACAEFSLNNSISKTHLVSPAELVFHNTPSLNITQLVHPGPQGGERDTPPKDPNNTRLQTSNLQSASLTRGRMNYPVIDSVISPKSQDLDLLRLRKNDPIRIMMQEGGRREDEMNIFSKYILTTALAEMVVENQLVAYARSIPLFKKSNNPLYPLTPQDVGRYVWRFNPIKRSYKTSSGSLVGSWQGPWRLSFVRNEIVGVVEGILRGKLVAYRASIDHLRPYYDISLASIPGIHQGLLEPQGKEEELGEDKDGTQGKEEHREEELGENKDDHVEQDEGEGEDSEEEDDVYSCEELKAVYPKEGKIKVPVQFISTIREYPTMRSSREIHLLADLPDSSLVILDPRFELMMLGEDIDEMVGRMEEGMESEETLLFHGIFPFNDRTRSEKLKRSQEIEEERKLMETKYQVEEEPGREQQQQRQGEGEKTVYAWGQPTEESDTGEGVANSPEDTWLEVEAEQDKGPEAEIDAGQDPEEENEEGEEDLEEEREKEVTQGGGQDVLGDRDEGGDLGEASGRDTGDWINTRGPPRESPFKALGAQGMEDELDLRGGPVTGTNRQTERQVVGHEDRQIDRPTNEPTDKDKKTLVKRLKSYLGEGSYWASKGKRRRET